MKRTVIYTLLVLGVAVLALGGLRLRSDSYRRTRAFLALEGSWRAVNPYGDDQELRGFVQAPF